MSGQGEVKIEFTGRLTMETVPGWFSAGLRQLEVGDLTADFSRVEAVDSAAISLMLGWQRAAQAKQRKLNVVGWPQDLLSLARLYGVDDLLPLRNE